MEIGTVYEWATIVFGVGVVYLYFKVKFLESQLYRSTKCLHMVGQGKWTVEATEDDFTVFDDEGDKLMRVSKR
jgi:hypothetical protein